MPKTRLEMSGGLLKTALFCGSTSLEKYLVSAPQAPLEVPWVPLKNILFCRHECGWRWFDFLWKISDFGCKRAQLSSKKYAYKRPPKKRPVLQHRHLWIQNVWFEHFRRCETTKRCRKLPCQKVWQKKDAFDNPESTSEEIISTLGVKMAAVRSVWTVESTYADSQTPVTQPSHLLGLCDI